MQKESRIFVTGHRGLAGGAIVRRCELAGFHNLVVRTRSELDLADQAAVERFFASERPEYVFHAAGCVGGIHANESRPADFIRDNIQLAVNVIDSSWRHGVKKLLNLGSSCIYPKLAPQPLREESLLAGALEPTNEWYAVAKIAALKMGQAYSRQYGFQAITLLPTNLYGPGDNFHPTASHVLPGLLRRIDEARAAGEKSVVVWGTGAPRREFLYVDDLADACLFAMEHYDDERPINVGWGWDVTIHELAQTIAHVVGYRGHFDFDTSKPDGTPRKVLDTSRLAALGWRPRVDLRSGLALTYDWYRRNEVRGRQAVS